MPNLLRYTGYTLIHIVGLTIGLASSILILLFVPDELCFDRFHKDYRRLCRVSAEGNIQGIEVSTPVIAVSTILFHGYRATVRNPMDALKMD